MKKGFYLRLAWTGISKNRRFYIPYIFTCMVMVMMEYIITALVYAPTLDFMRGREFLKVVLKFGSGVIAIFSVLFLFYTHSFLMRRREKEFGLYRVLGMEKRNISRILLWEKIIIAAVSIAGGLAAGMLFSKLAELLLSNIIGTGVVYTLSVSWTAARLTIIIFGAIFLIMYLYSVKSARTADPISLMQRSAAGEKPPRENRLMGYAGFVLLISAYALAVSITQPLSAIMWFFAAVVMVIIATYAVFISGSVTVCRALKKNKKYYYRADHFVSVSSMTHRMKRNGAGLASICVLSTMVLVMILTTASLYFGMDESLKKNYPRDVILEVTYSAQCTDEPEQSASIAEETRDIAKKCEMEIHNEYHYRCAYVSGILENGVLDPDVSGVNVFQMTNMKNLCTLALIPAEDYERMTGKALHLNGNEAAIYCEQFRFDGDSIEIPGGMDEKITQTVEKWEMSNRYISPAAGLVCLFVNDYDEITQKMAPMVNGYGNRVFTRSWTFCTNTFSDDETIEKMGDAFRDSLKNNPAVSTLNTEYQYLMRDDYLYSFGGLFFLGILLSIVFLLATVLLIYYKQLTEGYEDQSRFDIMQKVGMTKKNIRESINSQMRTVFFLPVAGAIIHTAFAFPLIRRMLMIFYFMNTRVMLITGGIAVITFAAFYAAVYRTTSNAYYRIVSDAKDI